MKDKDTTESIFFLSFLCMLTLLLWDPEGLAGAQRRLVSFISEIISKKSQRRKRGQGRINGEKWMNTEKNKNEERRSKLRSRCALFHDTIDPML
eukprot:scaffold42733_cov66-Cyclotella_meneghiniana.AAC.4